MTKPLPNTAYAVLGFLTSEEPMSGYEVHQIGRKPTLLLLGRPKARFTPNCADLLHTAASHPNWCVRTQAR